MKYFKEFHERYPDEMIKWVESQRWTQFNEIQKLAIKEISIDESETLNDCVLASETSSGKTEAAYIPLIARIFKNKLSTFDGFSILYISPLTALINDQYKRLGERNNEAKQNTLAGVFNLNFIKWHSGESKSKLRSENIINGILLTTPESIESLFVHSSSRKSVWNSMMSIRVIIVDEFHAYFDGARGRHLQSLLKRLDHKLCRQIPRIALSATLGSGLKNALEFLRPHYTIKPTVLTVKNQDERKTKITLKVFLEKNNSDNSKVIDRTYNKLKAETKRDFINVERGLVFCNSRAGVEQLHERINSTLENSLGDGNPTQFARHYSNLPAKEKNRVEKLMRAEAVDLSYTKMTTICTNTLELGIDIGNVTKVGQIDSTFTVASLRQRIGRSGRRENPSEGIIYVIGKLGENDHPLDALQIRTFQAAASINLALEGQFESPTLNDLHLSTLVHQILSLIHEKGNIEVEEVYKLLIETGPWDKDIIDKKFFHRFLESLEEAKFPLVTSLVNGQFTFAPFKEAKKNRRPAYAVFRTPPQYTVLYHNKPIGQLPMTVQYRSGDTFILNRGRWKVVLVNETSRKLIVTRVPYANAPRFGGSAQAPSGMIVSEMLRLYRGEKEFGGISKRETSQSIEKGRETFDKLGLRKEKIISFGKDVLIFPFCGARRMETLLLLLRREGLHAEIHSFAINIVDADTKQVRDCIKEMKKENQDIDLDELARESLQLCSDRYDRYLTPYHQRLTFAHRFLDSTDIALLLNSIVDS